MDFADDLPEDDSGQPQREQHNDLMIARHTDVAVGEPAGELPESATEDTPVSTAGPEEFNAPKPADFALFGRQIAANDIDGAGRTLAELLEVDQKLAHQCATSFRERLNEDPTTIQKAMLLRTKLMTDEKNDSLMILWDCFRLQGPQAVEVMQTLKTRLAAP